MTFEPDTELLTWQIGQVRISRVVETGSLEPLVGMFPSADVRELAEHREWLEPDFVDAAANVLMSIHSFIVESRGRRIVVDTCVNPSKSRSWPGARLIRHDYLAALTAAGADPATVDVVVCTHLHFDHVGWHTRSVDGRWSPTFPSASYLVNRVEWEYWDACARQGAEPAFDSDAVRSDTIEPLVDAGLVQVVEPGHAVTDEVHLVATPGHTPGHVAVAVDSDGAEAVITGDLIHSPVQMARPDWFTAADVDPDRAVETRSRCLRDWAARKVVVLGTHFPAPTAGRVVPSHGTWGFDTSDMPRVDGDHA